MVVKAASADKEDTFINNNHHHHSHNGRHTNGRSNGGGGAVWVDDDDDDDDVYVPGTGNEAEEERDSLLRETADQTALHSRQALRFRKAARPNPNHRANKGSSRTTVLGLLRGHTAGSFLCHGVAITGILAALAIFLPGILVELIGTDLQENPQDKEPPHQPSLGGGYNPGSANNADFAFQNPVETATEEFPKSNVGVAVVSVTPTNRANLAGHFWHDPYQSPYASPFYAASRSSSYRKQQQARFDASRLQVMQQFGYFSHSNANFEDLRRPNFDYDIYRDKPIWDFPLDAWQSDEQYLKLWLHQAKALVGRVKEGIYQEYGYNDKDATQEQRREQFQVWIGGSAAATSNFTIVNGAAKQKTNPEGAPLPGIAHLTPAAWKGLVRKLLHACMTHDDFYATAVGPASGTFRGNNLAESQIMQFHSIMEPVFDKLGVRLISRNMGMDASTTISALGGADLYGEADILWVLPPAMPFSNANNNAKLLETLGQFDLLHKQAILSGERMPVILTPREGRLETETDGKAWVGNIQPGATVCPQTTVKKSGKNKTIPVFNGPEACHYLRCGEKAAAQKICHRYRSQCWVERSDWNPGPDDTKQELSAGSQDEGFPGYQQHRWEGRKLAMLVLMALEEALETWSTYTEQGAVPLPEEVWHVGDAYEELRESVRTLLRQPGHSAAIPHCEQLLRDLDPMICHMSMHAYTEWTPRVNPAFNRLRNITVDDDGKSIPDSHSHLVDLYDNVDLRPPEWQVPTDAIDVHMIAIATNASVNDDKSLEDLIQPEEECGDYFSCADEWDDDGLDVPYSGDPLFEYEYDGGRQRKKTRARNLRRKERRRLAATQQRKTEETDPDVPAKSTKWTIRNAPIGFCDGSAQSRCHRAIGNKCLMANYNAYKAGIVGTGNSGWLHMTLRNFKEGVILVRFDFDVGTKLMDLPDDFVFDYKIDNASFTLTRQEFVQKGALITSDLTVHPLMINAEMSHNALKSQDQVKVSIRVTSEKDPEKAKVVLTHVYYA